MDDSIHRSIHPFGAPSSVSFPNNNIPHIPQCHVVVSAIVRNRVTFNNVLVHRQETRRWIPIDPWRNTTTQKRVKDKNIAQLNFKQAANIQLTKSNHNKRSFISRLPPLAMLLDEVQEEQVKDSHLTTSPWKWSCLKSGCGV